ncbi:hypothetical protein DSO57_1004900 [Entomophthora muscae]|uniref:Uncharacterized protein n=1 Tax=Entomophthora muscae TaxID=34485 RepID=A0ACC2TVY0_9FUNG|nr:hypothetical protein DSO57_1004900 [Entomophthora muscae]
MFSFSRVSALLFKCKNLAIVVIQLHGKHLIHCLLSLSVVQVDLLNLLLNVLLVIKELQYGLM